MTSSSEPWVKQLSDDLYLVVGTVGRLNTWRESGRSFAEPRVFLEEKRLWVRRMDHLFPERWCVSDTPDAPTTYPKPKYRVLLEARFETASGAVQAAKEWLMEKEAAARLGGA